MQTIKNCSICNIKFIPTDKNSEYRQCCKECIKEFNNLKTKIKCKQ